MPGLPKALRDDRCCCCRCNESQSLKTFVLFALISTNLSPNCEDAAVGSDLRIRLQGAGQCTRGKPVAM